MRILLVEDEAVTRLDAAHTLRTRGHSVVEAADGEEALRAVERDRFDLVVLDLVMPGMNGLEFLCEARKREVLRCPVYVLSAYSPEWCQGIDVTRFLSKPVSGDELALAVQGASHCEEAE